MLRLLSRMWVVPALKEMSMPPLRAMFFMVMAVTVVASAASAGEIGSTATSQVSSDAVHEQASPPDVLTGREFRTLTKMMLTDAGRCGVPQTAVVRWHVLPDGLIDDFVLHKSSGNACFDELVTLNAEKVIDAKLRITPAMRHGVAEAGWVPFAVAARD
jgi:hypothetical protein